jgi:hypothetical protein
MEIISIIYQERIDELKHKNGGNRGHYRMSIIGQKILVGSVSPTLNKHSINRMSSILGK